MIEIIQIILLVLAGWSLFAWLRAATKHVPSFDRRVVELGLLLRLGGGFVAYIVSYLRLPFFRSLQFDPGLWFFAMDGRLYESAAREVASHGVLGLGAMDKWYPSHVYVTVLAAARMLFGGGVATGIFLNGFFWLGVASLIIAWPGGGRARRYRSLSLVLIAFSPMAILWSTQPLKDPMFLCTIVLFFWSTQRFAMAIRRRPCPWMLSLSMGIVVVISTGIISGIRWYFSVFVLGAFGLHAFLVTFASPGRRTRVGFSYAVILMAALFTSAYSAQRELPAQITHYLVPGSAGEQRYSLLDVIDSSRKGFETTAASTQIRPGALVPGHERSTVVTLRVEGSTTATAGAPTAPSGNERTLDRSTLPPVVGLVAAVIAAVTPHALAERLRLVNIAGGRGLWLFADMDTIWFDLILVAALVAIWRGRRRGSLRDPMVRSLVAFVFVVGGSLLYVITNFGTLIRHRGIVGMVLVLVPLAVDGLEDFRATSRADVEPARRLPPGVASENAGRPV